MKIVVCVKQVAVLGDEVEFADDALDVDPDYLDFALNEWDSYATEEALRTRESLGAEGDEIVVRMKNTSQALAFQVNAQVLDSTNNNVPTVAWNDNFIELMPQESQTISAPVPKSVKPDSLTVQVSGWNMPAVRRQIK